MSNPPTNPEERRLVLCVEGDRNRLEQMERALNRGGYDVLTAGSGEIALQFVSNIKPDLILLDVSLPDMSGYDFCARLQETKDSHDIPALLQAPPEEARDKGRALSAGAVAYIEKPVGDATLLKKVTEHIQTKSRWRKLREGSGIWRQSTMRSEFPRFKRHLVRILDLPPEKVADVKGMSPSSLYALCATVGITTADMAQHVARFLKLDYVSNIDLDQLQLGVLPASYCKTNFVVPLERSEGLVFLVSNPFDWQLLGTLMTFVTRNKPLELVVTEPDRVTALFEKQEATSSLESGEEGIPQILEKLQKRYESKSTDPVHDASTTNPSEPVILLANQIIENAYEMGASDIHIEPWEECVVVRYRIDGELRIVNRLRPRVLVRPLVSRLKIMSGLDISERRLPQDGRIVFKEFTSKECNFDLRVATAPMNYGEKVVMRIVDKSKSVLPLSELGFSERHLELYRQKIRTPYGMVLHVGPTGSGKSMTLYAALNEVQRPEVNIQTAEDPIEYTLPGINQLQVRPGVGLTFQRALRSYLRQDPDIILIGEIRDIETVEIAVEAALTGHLLLSTLHTNDAASTVTRMIQMGIEPFMVSSSIVLICAQRLLRRFCSACKQPYRPEADELELVGLPPDAEVTLFRPVGCEECNGIGYRGRIGIHEILVPNDELRIAINRKGVTAEALKAQAVRECGMTTLYWDAVEKVRHGITSVQELTAKIRRDEFDAQPAWLRQGAEEPTSS